jgi:lipoprotein-releasing system permease protein
LLPDEPVLAGIGAPARLRDMLASRHYWRGGRVSLYADIAASHLRSRRRQTVVSLLGVVLGVAFFLAVSSLMRGSERDFIKRLVDTAPHITISDEFRNSRRQPATFMFPDGAVSVRHVKPLAERRGIRQYKQKLEMIDAEPGVTAAPVLAGQAIFSFAGRDQAVTLSGIVPRRMKSVSAIAEDMTAGSLDAVESDHNGIIIGEGLAKKMSLSLDDTVSVVASQGNSRPMRIVGLFRTGNIGYDEGQTFAQLKRVQALMNRPNVANSIIIRLDDPYRARDVATRLEQKIGYKTVSWQEASEDILNTLLVRNIIMYSVVGAILLVASFGIYNVISTVVMEKTRDIAILKSIGFHARDIRRIFLIEGFIMGVAGSAVGLVFGSGLMAAAQRVVIKVPGQTELIHLPIYWGIDQFALAVAFAMISAVTAAYLPARKGGSVQPVDILRGAA